MTLPRKSLADTFRQFMQSEQDFDLNYFGAFNEITKSTNYD